MKYCKQCDREVGYTKRFNWIAFLLWTVCFGAGLYVYFPWWILFGKKTCKICGCEL